MFPFLKISKSEHVRKSGYREIKGIVDPAKKMLNFVPDLAVQGYTF
jgi:hypothetical protein